MLNEHRYVIAAITERRHLHRDDVQTVIEILSKRSSATIFARSELVAAITRTSTLIV